MKYSEFKKYYDACFDEHGEMKPCGREVCIELLEYLGDRKYGDVNTGFVNIKAVNSLHDELKISAAKFP